MTDIRQTIADNLVAARKAAHMTQAELAEQLNYSDKAVSKWERGESIPDVLVLKEIADLYSVTVDYFLTPHGDGGSLTAYGKKERQRRVAILLTLWIATALVAFVLFWIFKASFPTATWQWKVFIAMIPLLSVELLVFSRIFSHPYLVSATAVSGIAVGAILTAFFFVNGLPGVTFPPFYIFILSIPAVALTVTWHIFAARNSRTARGRK